MWTVLLVEEVVTWLESVDVGTRALVAAALDVLSDEDQVWAVRWWIA